MSNIKYVGMTVANLEQSETFYAEVLSFQKIADTEVWGEDWEKLQGVFGLRMRVVQMQLGDEIISLMEYLTPQGRPIPVDSHSNDRWFQHFAIVVTDMDLAYEHIRQYRVRHSSTSPQQLPEWNKKLGGVKAFQYQTVIAVADLETIADQLRSAPCSFISPGIVKMSSNKMGYTKALSIRDVDGHVLLLVQE